MNNYVKGKYVFTVDLEDWYQGNEIIKISDKHMYEDRLIYSTDKILQLLDKFSIKATFFILAHVIEDKPEILTRISQEGHEIASHGYSHELVYKQDTKTFKQETEYSKKICEDIIGKEVIGYRASNWSITSNSLWALDIIQELGFKYDSSIFPTKNYLYGIPNSPVVPYYHNNGLLEIPPSTVKIFNVNIPFSGGFYFRLLPYWMINMFAEMYNKEHSYPAIFYIHPWELDVEQPRTLKLPTKNRFIHYHNISSTESKLNKLFALCEICTIKSYFDQLSETNIIFEFAK